MNAAERITAGDLANALNAIATQAPVSLDRYVATLTRGFLGQRWRINNFLYRDPIWPSADHTISDMLLEAETRLTSGRELTRAMHWAAKHVDLHGLMAVRDALLAIITDDTP